MLSMFAAARSFFNRQIRRDQWGPEHDVPIGLGPMAGSINDRDGWPAWTDEVRFATAPVGPTRRGFLGLLAGALAAAGLGTVGVTASTVVPSPGPLERAYRRWMAAMDEVDRAAADDGKFTPYGSPECDRQEAWLVASQEVAGRARKCLLELIGDAAGYDFPDPTERELEAGSVLAHAREGAHLFMVVVDEPLCYGIRDDSEEVWRRRSYRPVVVLGAYS